MAITLTNDNFAAQVLQAAKPVLVDFWAPWCGPCRNLAPVLDKLSKELTTVTIGKVDVDQAGNLAQQYNITNIPCMILFKAGKEVARHSGFLPEPALRAFLQKYDVL